MRKPATYTALLLLIFFWSCKKKEKDTSSPSLGISSPVSGAFYKMYDTIIVSGHVSDDKHLSSVVVTLTDANNAVQQYSYSVPIQSNDFNFSIQYYLTNYHLSSGYYYISVTAGDGSNTTQRSTKIYITESPTLKTGYYVVGASQPKTIVKYNTAFAQQSSISLNTGFNGMAFAPYYRMLYVNGTIYQPLQAYDEQTNGLAWSYNYNGSGMPTTVSMSTDGTDAYVGYYAGSVMRITNTGQLGAGYSTGNNIYYPTYFTLTSAYGTGVFKDKTGSAGDKLYCFYRGSGFYLNSAYTPLKAIAIFEHTQNEFYVVGNNSSGQAQLYLYSVQNNAFTGPFVLPTGKLLSAVQADSDFLLLGMDNGNIYGYKYSTGNCLPLAGAKAQQLAYNNKLGEVTAAVRNNLYSYSLSTNYNLTQINMQTFTDSIIGFDVITNK